MSWQKVKVLTTKQNAPELSSCGSHFFLGGGHNVDPDKVSVPSAAMNPHYKRTPPIKLNQEHINLGSTLPFFLEDRQKAPVQWKIHCFPKSLKSKDPTK